MLLKQYDNNPDFHGWRNTMVTEFKKNTITLQLTTFFGHQPLDDGLTIGGGWKLQPMHDLTVSVLLSHIPDLLPIPGAHNGKERLT